MDKEKMQAYTARIAQANRSELVVIIYELILESMESAGLAYEAEDLEGFVADMKKAQLYLNELMGSLNYQYAVSFDLMQLYQYVNKQFITSITRREPVETEGTKEVLQGLLKGFEEVAKQDTSPPVMERKQQLYAGLTYGKGTLNEVFVDVNEQKSFKA